MGILEPSRAIGDLDLKRMPKAKLAVSTEPALASAQLVRSPPAPQAAGAASFAPNPSECCQPFLVLASDGLWDFVQPGRVLEVATQALEAGLGASGAGAARRLAEEAKASGSQDDITVIVVAFAD
jgi:serine/threonine protein phosphatase PrpC